MGIKSEKVKILAILDRLNYGGAETYFLTLFDKIDRDRFSFYVTYSEEGNLQEEFCKREVVLLKTPAITLKNPFGARKLYNSFRSLIKENKIDIIQTNFFASGLWSSLAAKKEGVICLGSMWASLLDQPGETFLLKKIFRKFYINLTDTYLTFLNSSRTELINKRGIQPDRIRLVNLFIDTDKFKPGGKDPTLIKEFNLKEQDLVVGMVANLKETKGIETFLEAMPLIVKNVKNIKFIIVGEGPLRNKLLFLAKSLGVAESVIFTGFRSDVYKILRIFDLAVQAGPNQLGGLAVLESLATGVPVVSSNCYGQEDLIKEEVSGFLFKPSDAKSLADVVIDALSRTDGLMKMKLSARKFVKDNFDFKIHVSQIEELYLQLANRGHEGANVI